jgi:uncharacterized protein (DUF1697 family)
MADLRALFEALEAEDVETYVQSGNVVYRSASGGPASSEQAIRQELSRQLGLDVAVLLRTKAQLAKVVSANPLAEGSEPVQLHVTFLAERPAPARVRALDPERSAPDVFRVAGREVYLRCPNGYGRSKLSNAFFEQQLGVAATTRNWRTVTTLAELASSRS